MSGGESGAVLSIARGGISGTLASARHMTPEQWPPLLVPIPAYGSNTAGQASHRSPFPAQTVSQSKCEAFQSGRSPRIQSNESN